MQVLEKRADSRLAGLQRDLLSEPAEPQAIFDRYFNQKDRYFNQKGYSTCKAWIKPRPTGTIAALIAQKPGNCLQSWWTGCSSFPAKGSCKGWNADDAVPAHHASCCYCFHCNSENKQFVVHTYQLSILALCHITCAVQALDL